MDAQRLLRGLKQTYQTAREAYRTVGEKLASAHTRTGGLSTYALIRVPVIAVGALGGVVTLDQLLDGATFGQAAAESTGPGQCTVEIVGGGISREMLNLSSFHIDVSTSPPTDVIDDPEFNATQIAPDRWRVEIPECKDPTNQYHNYVIGVDDGHPGHNHNFPSDGKGWRPTDLASGKTAYFTQPKPAPTHRSVELEDGNPWYLAAIIGGVAVLGAGVGKAIDVIDKWSIGKKI